MKFRIDRNTLGAYNPRFIMLPHGLARLNVYFTEAKYVASFAEGAGNLSVEEGPTDFVYWMIGFRDQTDGKSADLFLIPETKEESDYLLSERTQKFLRALKREAEIVFIPTDLHYHDVICRNLAEQ